MTASERLERNLPGILDDLSAGPSPDFLDDVFAQTARMRQRPGWTFPERLLPMADIARTRAYVPVPPWRLIAVALLLIAIVVAALLVAGSQRRVAPPFGPARNGQIVYDLNGDSSVTRKPARPACWSAVPRPTVLLAIRSMEPGSPSSAMWKAVRTPSTTTS